MERNSDWWKSAVFYQIYPKSFQDTTGSGFGDLAGITRHLDYIQSLGVDGIWISPFYKSPQKDNGYDVSDYRSVDERFGTMDDFDQLVQEADARGLIIMTDLVLNHTSDEHPWFEDAKSSRDSEYHDFYIWRDGTADSPPNDLEAIFGGSAWTYVPEIGQYYFNMFSPGQPDLNWSNPKVREALYDMIRWWTERGVGGFRLDAIEFIGKDVDQKNILNGDLVAHYLHEMKEASFPETDFVTVGETLNAPLDMVRAYSNPDGSTLSMVFQGDAMIQDHERDEPRSVWTRPHLHLPALKKSYEKWRRGLYGTGWAALYISNHDLPRIVSSWGDEGEYRRESATMLAAMLHGMQGTPFIYQGEEIGMTNIALEPEQYNDLETRFYYKDALSRGMSEAEVMAGIHARSRDNARTPMQWSSAANAGFTDGTPWLPVNPNYSEINVEEAENDPNSILNFYRKLIALRRKYPVLRDGTFTLLDADNENTFCYTRDTDDEHLLVQCNFTPREQPETLPDGYSSSNVVLANYPDPEGPLRPYETRILHRV